MMAKSFLSFLLAGILVLSLAACQSRDPEPEEEPQPGREDGSEEEPVHECILESDPDNLCGFGSDGLAANPNGIDEQLYHIFSNVLERSFSMEAGSIARQRIDVIYCPHGSIYAQSDWTLEFTGNTGSDPAAAATGTFTRHNNSQVSDMAHRRTSCEFMPAEGTPAAETITTYQQLADSLETMKTPFFADGFQPEYLQSVESEELPDSEGFLLTAVFTPEAEAALLEAGSTLSAYTPAGERVLCASMQIDSVGTLYGLSLEQYVEDSSGQQFPIYEIDYTFSPAQGFGRAEAPADTAAPAQEAEQPQEAAAAA